MARPIPELPEETGPTRRTFLHAGTTALLLGGAGAPSAPGAARAEPAADEGGREWRNKQADMAYRRLGRTGLMISEVVCGGDPITLGNYKHLELALEMGLNYLDMAPAYNKGDTERAYGKLLAGSSSKRDKVFLTTKVSSYNSARNRLYREILDGLPESKQEVIRKKAREIKEERRLEQPGYFFTYFPGQRNAFEPAYLGAAMQTEYGAKVEGSRELR